MRVKNVGVLIVILCFFILHLGNISLAEKQKPKELKPIGLLDSLNWNSIRNPVVSNNGLWFSYRLLPNKGDSKVIFRQVKGDTEYKFDAGEAPRYSRNANIAFSEDGGWGAYIIYPDEEEVKKSNKQKKKLFNKVGLINLKVGNKTIFKKVKKFSFSGENPDWITFHKYLSESKSKDKKKSQGSDMILYHLSSGAQYNIGNVSEYAFDKMGNWLGWIIDAEDMSGNGVLLKNLSTGAVKSLDSGKFVYKKLTWKEEGDAFCVLRGQEDKEYKDKKYSVIGFHTLLKRSPDKVSYDPEKDKQFPKGMTLSPNRNPLWTDDLSGILIGIHELKKKEEKDKKKEGKSEDKKQEKKEPNKNKDSDEDLPGLVIWHWLDKRLQSMQQVQEKRDKNFSFLSIYRIKENKFIRLAQDNLRQVEAAPKHRFAIGFDDSEYRLSANLEGRRYRDIHVINLKSGKTKLVVKKNRWYYGPSPNGTRFLFYQDGHFFTYNMLLNQIINISKDIPSSFVNEESDVNVIKPPARPFGWVKGGKSILLSDMWDVWHVSADGGKGENLTLRGKKDGIRFQRRFVLDPEEKGIDLTGSVFFSAYGEWTKKGGIAGINKGRPGVTMLLWQDAAFSRLMKAKNASVYIYTKETHEQYPDFYVSKGGELKKGIKITSANPQQKDFSWSAGVRLINYESAKGKKLQAALYLPAKYEKGKSYPTIIYIYEKLSYRLHRYFTPSARGFNKSVYTSNGYAVLMPDIVYKVNDPGMSAVWCVIPALKAAIKSGIVDKNRVAIHGHSWGGYQTAFLITQTDMFKAAIAGAPLTNMISMYSSIYWNTGSANQPIFESSQGRFFGGYWDNIDSYTRNSPVYHAKKVTTPLIILHNDKDGAVDWNQGIEYFNTLRRLKKPVIMLQYKGENHGLRKPVNQVDYTVRMREFFDHHLLGKSAPTWLSEGVSHLKIKEHLKNRIIKPEKKKEKQKTEKKNS
jgi:dipeptidyl aminopeptidase/acylaminoacyl peptidase